MLNNKRAKAGNRFAITLSRWTGPLLFVVLISYSLGIYTYTRVRPHTSTTVHAATASTLNFQARLLNTDGSIVADGYYNIEFKLYDAATGGTNLWTETRYDSNGVTAGNDNRLQVRAGYVSAYLGDITAFPGSINWDQELWITMNIGGTTHTATPTWDGEMTPRLRLTAVPYAFQAKQSEKLYKNQGSFIGEVDFATLTGGNQIFQLPDQGAAGTYSICVTTCTPSGGSGNYIQNTTSLQTTANFNIQAANSGANGTVGGVIRGAAAGQTVDLLQLQNTAGNVLAKFNANGDLIIGGVNSAASATALQVQNTSGTDVVTIDTSSSKLVIRSASGDATLGSELLSGDCTGTNWAGTGSGPYVHTSGSSANLTCAVSGGVVAGATYQVTYSATGMSTTETVIARIGGVAAPASVGNATQTAIITATTTAAPYFSINSSTITGSISGITYKQVATVNVALQVNNASGVSTLEVRSSSSTTNVFVGLNSGKANQNFAVNNTAVGSGALQSNTTGNNNSAFGYGALQNNTTGTVNVAVGSGALMNNTTGYRNVALGYDAMRSNNSGIENVAIGWNALYSNTRGNNNVAIGRNTLYANTTGLGNTALGDGALYANTTGSSNIALGTSALAANTSGTQSIAVGASALANTTGGTGNIGIGASTLLNNTIYQDNIAIGTSAGYRDYNGYFNTLNGVNASVAIGTRAQVQASNTIVLGSVDVAMQTVIGATRGQSTNTFGVSPLDYQTGTATRTNSSATLTGTGTTWTSAMVGDIIIFADGTTNTVSAFTSATSITMGTTYTGTTDASPVYYRFHRPGLQVTNTGRLGVGVVSPNAQLQVVSQSGTSNDTLVVDNGGSTGNIFIAKDNGAAVLTIADGGAITATNSLTVNGGINLGNASGFTSLKGTDFSTTGTSNNVNFGTGTLFRLTGASAQTITGITGGTDGRRITLINAASQSATLSNLDGGSSAANQITTGTGANLTLLSGSSIELIYDSGASLWRVAAAGTTGGGIGGSGTNNYIAKFTPNGTTLGNSIIFDNGTNVGIGTASPQTTGTLSVNYAPGSMSNTEYYGTYLSSTYSGVSNTYAQGLRIETVDTHTVGTQSKLTGVLTRVSQNGAGTTTNAYGVYSRVDASAGLIQNAYGVYVDAGIINGTGVITNAYSAAFMGGNVGIGTNTPSYLLDVNGALRVQPLGSAPTAAKGVVYYDNVAAKFKCSEDGTTFVNCVGNGTTPTLQQAYANSTGGTTPEILLDTTRTALNVQDANTTLGATANLFAVTASATASTLGTTLFAIQGNGNVNFGSGTTAPNKLSINALSTADSTAVVALATGSTTNKGLVIQGASSQSADLFQVQTSTGTALTRVTKDGYMISNSVISTNGLINIAAGLTPTTSGGTISNGGPTYGTPDATWTATATGQTMTIDFGTSLAMNVISFSTWWRNDFNYIPANFTIDTSADGSSWTNFKTITGNTDANPVYTNGPVNRYIRLTVNAFQSGQSSSKVSNFQVFSTARVGENDNLLTSRFNNGSLQNVFLNTTGNLSIGSTWYPSNTLTMGYDKNIGIELTPMTTISGALAAGGTLSIINTYYYVVQPVVGNAYRGMISNEVSFSPTLGNQTVNLSWAAVPGAQGYTVLRGTTAGGENKSFWTPTNSFSDTGGLGTNDGIGTAQQAMDLMLQAGNNNSWVSISSGANFGVGTSIPKQKLHVVGAIQSDATSTAAGSYSLYIGASDPSSDMTAYSNRELRIQAVNDGTTHNKYLLFDGRISGSLASPTYNQGDWGRFSGIEFAQAGDINFLVNTGSAGSGSNTTITPTKALTILQTAKIGVGDTNPATNLVVKGTGGGICIRNTVACPDTTAASLFIENNVRLGVDTRTIANNGTGGSNATLTLNPTASYVEITCNDPDGCDITMSEASPVSKGQILDIVNIGSNAVNFADTANVSELNAAFAAGQWDTIDLLYVSDRWVELSRSNN